MNTVKDECISLRKRGMSLGDISKQTGVAKSTLSGWLKNYPISEDERKRSRNLKLAKRKTAKEIRSDRKKSKYYEWIKEEDLSRLRKAKIAESAVLFRLCLLGYSPFGSVFDGDRTDWLVEVGNEIIKMQVKYLKTESRYGQKFFSLTCIDGNSKSGKRRTYTKDEVDLFVGYDLEIDAAYVWSWDDVGERKSAITAKEDAKERWDKVKEFRRR